MSIEDPTEIMYAFQSGKDLFRNSEGVGSAIHAVIAVIGLALMPLVLTAVVRDFKKTPSSPIILSICLGDSFYLLISLIYGIADASSNRWYFGYIGCVVNHIVVLAACYISILSLALLTLERYMGIVHRKPMTVTHTLPIVLLIWFISFLFAFWPLLTNSVEYGIMLSVGKLICSFNWATQNRVLLLIPVWMSIIVLVIGLFFIAFGYFQIVSLYFSVKKGLQDVKTQNPSSDTHDKQGKVDNAKITFSDADKRLLMKAIALTVTFILCWTPYFLLILIELFTNHHVSIGFDAFSCCCGLACSALSPYLLFFFDVRVRRTVLEMLGVQDWQIFTSKTSESTATKTSKSVASQSGKQSVGKM